MKLDELLEKRATAVERYAAATGELHAALIELAALDEVLTNGNVGYDDAPNVRSFVNPPQNLGTLAHPKFAPVDVTTCWRDQIKFRRDELLNSFKEIAR